MPTLTDIIADYKRDGAEHIKSLGICHMPQGYALMINADRTHYYYVTADGKESVINWDRWAVWRWAMEKCEGAK